MECLSLLLEHLAWIEHEFLNGIRDSRKLGSLWGMMRGVGGVRKSIHNWGDERGCDEGHWHAHTRGLPWGLEEVVEAIQQVHCSRRRLLWRGLEFPVCTINKSAHTKKKKKKSGNLFNDPRIFLWDFFHFCFVVSRNGKVYYSAGSLFLFLLTITRYGRLAEIR